VGSGVFFIATIIVAFHISSILPSYALGKMEVVEVTDQGAVVMVQSLETAMNM